MSKMLSSGISFFGSFNMSSHAFISAAVIVFLLLSLSSFHFDVKVSAKAGCYNFLLQCVSELSG